MSKANLGKAAAEANAVRAQLSDCAVYAPFGGTVVDQIAHRGEVAASGQPLLKIQSGGDLEVELIVPVQLADMAAPGCDLFIPDRRNRRDHYRRDHPIGSRRRSGQQNHPRHRQRWQCADSLILPGMSGSAKFDNRGCCASRRTRSNADRKGQGQWCHHKLTARPRPSS